MVRGTYNTFQKDKAWEEEPQEVPSTVPDELTLGHGMAILSVFMGPALFTIPYGFVMLGWSTLLIVGFSIAMMYFTATLQEAVLLEVEKALGMPETSLRAIGVATFGRRFQYVYSFIGIGEPFLIGSFVMWFVAIVIIEMSGVYRSVALAVISMMGMLMAAFPGSSFLIALGSVLAIAAVAMVCANALLLMPDHIDTHQNMFGEAHTGQGVLRSISYTFSAVALAIGDHAVFPSMRKEATPERFQIGLKWAFVMFSVLALMLCACTYAAFGTSISHVVLNNISCDGTGQKMPIFPGWCKSALWLVLALRGLLCLPVFLNPLADLIGEIADEVYPGPPGISDSELHKTIQILDTRPLDADVECILEVPRSQHDKKWSRWSSICVAFTACSFFTAGIWDLTVELEMVTGAIFKSMNVIILPCAGYLNLCGKSAEEGCALKALVLATMAFGIIW
eukprot:CAMPEP_0197629052 /NCGR_PEP_ID=MMETSP1338-20131121/7075_1 /TAXON_ID=43686 ORGANISM="Pelagodinium beii, Strain RCC1491" /NCGR_SAMPLE_ID=MMETSP1338 /ASSEMBLY_ACC=CAM_ASM_000754 /LENGTH=450 /DNA_ID=CAMNT_0043200059 /DNA_START=64 /DNA_END=1413 /DNA_ORIENTATION=-